MAYKERFISAVHKTKELGLSSGTAPLPLKSQLSEKKYSNIMQLCLEFLTFHGFKKSSDLAEKCIPVHMMLRDVIQRELSIKTYVTIGDRYWSDYVYCEMSYEQINIELENPDVNNPIKAHVWLTLPDGSVLDCTGEAHADLVFGRGEHPINECIYLFLPQRVLKEGYYRPYLVGDEFLIRTGSIRVKC